MVARWLQTIHKYHGSRYYGKAMNIAWRLTAARVARGPRYIADAFETILVAWLAFRIPA